MEIRDQVGIGIILGAVFPIIGYIAIQSIFSGLTFLGIMDDVTSGSSIGRERTLYLLAICCNLIIFNILKRQRKDNAMRGVVFPTLIYVCCWVYLYKEVLFGF